MELGIGPSLTAGWVLHLMVGLKLIKADMSVYEDRKAVMDAEKCKFIYLVLSILITIGESIMYISSGYYGPTANLSWFTITLIFLQLLAAGLICVYLDELLEVYLLF